MASVQRFVCDAEIFPHHVIKKQSALQDVEKQRHFAALIIQRVWRGYVVRKEIKRWHAAATVLQKYIRRFLVKWHMPDIYREYMEWYREQMYHKMATKIQALWRGYWVRKNCVNIKDLLAQKLLIEKANEEITRQMREAFENMEKMKRAAYEKEAREWVIYILFRLHHLIRTYVREGIYSLHNTTQLSSIEQLLKSLKMGNYMTDLKAKYYQEIKKVVPRSYMFRSRKLQDLEDAYRKFIQNYGTKDVVEADRNIHDKPFKLSSKLDKKQYKREMLLKGKYSSKKFDFARKTEVEKHVSSKDFDLHVLTKIVIDLKPPPYYIDFWFKLCDLHNLPQFSY